MPRLRPNRAAAPLPWLATPVQHRSLSVALEQRVDYLPEPGAVAGDALAAEWRDIWDVAHGATSRDAFLSDMHRLRKRHATKMAERAKQHAQEGG